MMTPDEAGAALAADPTFNLMTREEQETEAALLLGAIDAPSDDPLEIALALEVAAMLAELTPAPVANSDTSLLESCRNGTDENPAGCGGREPVAANGRCLTCGAYRKPPEAATAATAAVEPATDPEAIERRTVRATPETAASASPGRLHRADTPQIAQVTQTIDARDIDNTVSAALAAKLRHGVTYDPGASMLGRFKEVTGATDREAAGMLGLSRATVQAYAGGRLAEKLTDAQARVLIDDIGERLLLLADLKRDLATLIGEVE